MPVAASSVIRAGSEILQAAGIEGREAEILFVGTFPVERSSLYCADPEIAESDRDIFLDRVRRRAAREPMNYVTGDVEFLGLRLHVGPGVLIPRPETELWLEVLIERLRDNAVSPCRVLDLCAGSGCIGLALAREFPDADVAAVDISPDALRYARENAARNGVANIAFTEGDLFEPLTPGASFDLIVSNPPYIPAPQIETLEPDVRCWEPRIALAGGGDGLDFYRAIFANIRRFIRSGGIAAVETGGGQGAAVREMMARAGFADAEIFYDYAGHDRAVFGMMLPSPSGEGPGVRSSRPEVVY